MGTGLSEKLIKDIEKISVSYEVSKIVLFGSRARGDHKKTSDIDLAVFTLPGFKQKGRLSSELDDIETLLKFDIVFINENTAFEFLQKINQEGVIIYE